MLLLLLILTAKEVHKITLPCQESVVTSTPNSDKSISLLNGSTVNKREGEVRSATKRERLAKNEAHWLRSKFFSRRRHLAKLLYRELVGM